MKSKYIIISLIATIILYFLLGYIQNKATDHEYLSALVVKEDILIEKYDKLDKNMFEIKKVPSLVAQNALSSLNEVDGKYALNVMSGGDIVKASYIGDKNDAYIITVNPEKRKLAIGLESLADGIAGQVAKDTYVDILFTNSPTSKEPNITTETILQNIKVLGVTDSKGALIENSDGGQISAVILSVTPEQAHLLVNKERKGKFTLIGTSENALQYEPIIVK